MSSKGVEKFDHRGAEMLDDFLLDLIALVKEKALEAKSQRDEAAGEDRVFATGRLMAYHEMISLMQQQASAFGIGLDRLRLDDIEPERDLL